MHTVKIERDARGVAMIAMNRPEVHNAFDEVMIREIIEAFRDLGEDESVRVIVIAAEGKSFCAGADLNWMKRAADYDEDRNREDAGELALMLNAIYACPKPVIAPMAMSAAATTPTPPPKALPCTRAITGFGHA